MSIAAKALVWAALILAFAIAANSQGLGDDVSLLFIGGIAAIAVVHLYRGRRCCAEEC